VHVFSAIWDTGATNTVITENVAKQCGLAPTGMTLVQTAHGSKQANTYLVSVYLPATVHFRSVKVTEGELGGADLLIGMDIIGVGDFAVSSLGGQTVFTYRYPSSTRFDFVADHVPVVKRKPFTTQRKAKPGKPKK